MANSRRAEWFKLIEEWSSSNDTQISFCKSRALSLTTFGYYRSEYLRAQKRDIKEPVLMVPVEIADSKSSVTKHITSTNPSKVMIKTPGGFELAFDCESLKAIGELAGMLV